MSEKLLDEMRRVMRRRRYSIRTENSYCGWVKRYELFHRMQSRDDLQGGERKIESFLTHPAMDLRVASYTQNQALNALVFLYKHALKMPLDKPIDAARSSKAPRVPVVLSREETARVIGILGGGHQLVMKLLYGSGLRIIECLRLRVQDIDFAMKTITVRNGKGDKDRVTTFPATIEAV